MNRTIVFAELDHFVGFDWAEQKHDVVVVDRGGQVVLRLTFDDTAEGWTLLREKLAPLGRLGVAIETSRGPAVERLLEAGFTVFPMNPKSAQRYRDRKAPSGVKDDAVSVSRRQYSRKSAGPFTWSSPGAPFSTSPASPTTRTLMRGRGVPTGRSTGEPMVGWRV